uniref:Secreted protein n=1 Tax=Ixodes ricinus TaxID=34613 RepID=A0A6B0U5J3_IXORI
MSTVLGFLFLENCAGLFSILGAGGTQQSDLSYFWNTFMFRPFKSTAKSPKRALFVKCLHCHKRRSFRRNLRRKLG